MKQNFIEDNIIIISKQTLDKFLEQDKPSDLIGLYIFYYYTAKWQQTNIIKCSNGYVAKGLHWRGEKVIKNKKKLISIGLIENKQTKNKKGQITGWYVKMNYIWKKENIINNIKNQNTPNQSVVKPESGNGRTNALIANNLNALNVNNINKSIISINRNNRAEQSSDNKNSKSPLSEKERKKEIKQNKLFHSLIGNFQNVNPSYQKFYKNISQRSALKRLVEKLGYDQIQKAIKMLSITNVEQYAPVITTPIQLEDKLGLLIAFVKKQKKQNIIKPKSTKYDGFETKI